MGNYTLTLSVFGCLVFGSLLLGNVSAIPVMIASICLIGILITGYLRFHLQSKIDEEIDNSAIVSIRGVVAETDIWIWFRQTGEKWPPVSLWVAMDKEQLPLDDAPEELKEAVRRLLATASENDLQGIKACLASAGVTHPMDIQGACNSPIEDWVRETLLVGIPKPP